MRRILTIAAFFTAALGIAALSAQPSHAGEKRHTRSSDSGFSMTYSYGSGAHGSGYASGHGSRQVHDRRHNHRYAHDFRSRHKIKRHDRHMRRHLKPRHNRRHHGRYTAAPACHPTEKIAYGYHGQRQIVRGVMCYDAYGTPYILGGSRHIVAYR